MREDYREFIIQAYLWVVIKDSVFEGAGELWAGKAGHRLKLITNDIIGKF